jgi:hypothetical protein
MRMDNLPTRLSDLAELADANEYEVPINPGDHLDAAADALEAADKAQESLFVDSKAVRA